MAVKTYTPLLSEVLDKVHKAKTKAQKISILKENDSEALRMVIKSSFDPRIIWALPEGAVPYKPNEAPEGTEHTNLHGEARKLFHFLEGGNADLNQNKRETMFVQLLEGLHETDAEVLVAAKDKILHRKFKGLSDNVVKEAFDWNENYMKVDGYPQRSGPASG